MSKEQVPGVTGNAIIALGYVTGILRFAPADPLYRVIEVAASAAQATIEHVQNGNTYRISVEQIGGVP